MAKKYAATSDDVVDSFLFVLWNHFDGTAKEDRPLSDYLDPKYSTGGMTEPEGFHWLSMRRLVIGKQCSNIKSKWPKDWLGMTTTQLAPLIIS